MTLDRRCLPRAWRWLVWVHRRRLPAFAWTSHNALGSGILDRRRRHTWDRWWADRQHGWPALGIPEVHGFPQVGAGCAACGGFWLDDSEEVRLDKHAMDVDTAETIAGAVRLLRQAAVRAWAAADRAGAGSPGQIFALGVDLAADKAQDLVPDGTDIDGPVPAGGEPAGLLRSAELLLRRIAPIAAWEALDDLRATVADLVWEANTGGGVGA
jgi:hypothetical protein